MSIARNATYNLIASVIPIATSLLVLPVYIHTIGEARYGMVALIAALVGYFGVFSLGLSPATAQRIAAIPPDQVDERRRVFWTAVTLNSGLGLLGGMLILPVAYFYVSHGLKVEAGLRDEILVSVWWLALALPVSMLTGVLRGGLSGANRFFEMNVINVVVGTLSQVVPLAVALWIAPRLTVILPALYATRVLNIACYSWVLARRVLGSWRPTFDRSKARDLLVFGGWITISDLVSPLMTTLDRYLIGALVGLGAVSHYTVPYQMSERLLIFPEALLGAAFPRIAAAGHDERRRLGIRNLTIVAALMGAPMVAGVVVLAPLLQLWIGTDFARAAVTTGQIVLIGFWWNALGLVSSSWLYAAGRARAVTFAHLAEALPYFLVLYGALHWFGTTGAAIAFGLRVGADALLLSWRAGFLATFLRLVGAWSVLFALAFALRLPMGRPEGGAVALALVPLLLAGALSLYLLRDEKAALLALLRRRTGNAQTA